MAPGRPRADRPLTFEQTKELLGHSQTLINKRNDWGKRRLAAMQLGRELAHQDCIPALLAVLRDEGDDAYRVRQQCVIMLSWIADRRVLDFLIEALLDHDRNVAIEAHFQLQKLTGQTFHFERFERDPKSEMRQRYHQQWHDWWEAHRKDATITWFRALQM